MCTYQVTVYNKGAEVIRIEKVQGSEDRFLSPFVAAERGYIDDVIMPHGTRRRIVRGLKSLKGKELSNPWKKHDNIPL